MIGGAAMMYVLWPSSVMLVVGWRTTIPGIIITASSVVINCLLYMALRLYADNLPGSLFGKKRVDDELDEELQYHLEREIDEGLKAGLAPDEARYATLRVMGAIAKNKGNAATCAA
jgi:hypothetical protein